jgi:hypothetical protein
MPSGVATAGSTRYKTLIEGFCDFFTLNVRKAMTIDAPIAAQVEGPYALFMGNDQRGFILQPGDAARPAIRTNGVPRPVLGGRVPHLRGGQRRGRR